MKKNQPSTSDKLFRWLVWLLVIGFVASILWSMWVDTLQPLIQSGDKRAVLFNLIGLPVILLGTGVIVYGGFLFVRGTFTTMASPEIAENVARIRAGGSAPDDLRRVRRANLKALWDAWKYPLLWLGLGFAMIALGGFLINL